MITCCITTRLRDGAVIACLLFGLVVPAQAQQQSVFKQLQGSVLTTFDRGMDQLKIMLRDIAAKQETALPPPADPQAKPVHVGQDLFISPEDKRMHMVLRYRGILPSEALSCERFLQDFYQRIVRYGRNDRSRSMTAEDTVNHLLGNLFSNWSDGTQSAPQHVSEALRRGRDIAAVTILDIKFLDNQEMNCSMPLHQEQ